MLQSNQFTFAQSKNEEVLPFVSQITEADKELLKKTVLQFRPDSNYYEDSWGYIIQSTRYGGFKWYDKKNGSLLFFGRKSDSESTIVVPCFFAEPKYLSKVIETIQKALQTQKTILKNINPDQVQKFVSCGFRPYKPNEAWGIEAPLDDQTYPQSIVRLKSVVELQGKAYHNLRKTLRKDAHAIIREYKDEDLKSVLKVFASRDTNILGYKHSKHGVFYVSHVMYPTADIDKFVIIDKATDEIVGFTATSEINPTHAAFVALLFKPELKVTSIWGIYQTMVLICKKGYETVNFGGSESEGTDTFVKRNFHPYKQIAKTHLVYGPK